LFDYRLDQVDAPVQDGGLLRMTHRDRVFMAVTVEAYLVAGVHDLAELFGKCLDGVSRHEPGARKIISFKQVKEAWCADLTSENATGDIDGRIFAAVRSQPAGDRVHVDTKRAQDILRHPVSPYRPPR